MGKWWLLNAKWVNPALKHDEVKKKYQKSVKLPIASGVTPTMYGLRMGKPAGTRAKGALASCPFTLVFQLKLLFQKGAPFQHFFHSLVAKFS